MKTLKKIFPVAFKTSGTTSNFVISLLLHIVVYWLLMPPFWSMVGVVAGVMILIPVIGWAFFALAMLGVTVTAYYMQAEIFMLILAFCKVFKDEKPAEVVIEE